MSYLRFTERLPSGGSSRYYIFPSNAGIENCTFAHDLHETVSYKEINRLMASQPEADFKKTLGEKLKIDGEELEVLCTMLFRDKDYLRELEKKH